MDGDKVLFGTYRQIYGIFEGEVRAFTDIEFHVYDHTTGDLHTFADSPWWDQVASGLAWPLVLYRDHGVFCYGWSDAGYNPNNSSYLVIQNVESGVARPIPIPASPVDAGSLHVLYPIQVLRAPWRIVYGDYGTPDDWHTPTIHVLDLELAGYVDELGNVIPDPTYPPIPTN